MLAPPGALVPFGMASVPTGWLLCDGRAVLRATYAALYAAIGTTWGAGDNVSTFNLPDLRGEFLRGSDNGRGVDAGRAIASFQADGLKQHQHYVANYDFNASPAGTELTNNNTLMVSGNTHAEQGYTLNGSNTVATRGLSSETGGPETRPRNIAVLYCIKY
jgi:microcystin-dependent protein